MRPIPLALTLTALLTLSACPPGGECRSNRDCEPGQFCNRNGECQASYIPEVLDAAAYERPPRRRDAAVEDSAAEDRPQVDTGTPVDSSSSPDLRITDAGQSQASSFSVCDNPQDLAISSDATSLFVACLGSDEVRVYSSITGGERRNLSALESNCMPKALHLREDKNRLLVSCTSSGSNRVLDIDPATGANNRASIPTGAAPSARFASGGDLAAWSAVGSNTYALYNLNTAANPIGGSLQGGGGVAVKSDGTRVYLSQAQDQSNSIKVVDATGGTVGGLFMATPFASTQFAALAAGNNLIAFANAQQIIRIDDVQHPPAEAVQSPRAIRALIALANIFYVGTYDVASGDAFVYTYSADTGIAPALDNGTRVAGCTLSGMAAASDGRVFVACSNVDQVTVISP